MTIISRKRQDRLSDIRNNGRKMMCFENIHIPGDEWDKLIREFDINQSNKDDDEMWHWNTPDKSIEIWADKHVETDNHISNIQVCWNTNNAVSQKFVDKILQINPEKE